ncbi:uncharacterized protein LOC118441880 isoform X3 [Vespa mandarinia]|uniref:uncharacterized protein LOC118441880 isoform X3 n=1 Tax=Vespa mandarinia TaxID=7446 RepID=UPI00161F93E1|nr:uncharacterized protein LOC118441880 isoform X3 [Vespa mandarinia]XP_047351824.1 uncharacterized protein LOC124949949 isoform X2 [Vespa velutina]
MTARLHSLRHQEKKSVGNSHRQQHHQQSQHQQQAVHQGPSPAPSPSPSLSPSPKHSDGRRVSRYLDAPDIITGNTTPMDPAVKQRLLRHLDSCVSELDLDLGSRPDSGLGSSPGSVTDRVTGATSPGPLDHHVPPTPHCSTALNPAGLIKSEIPEMETARPDSSTTAGDENNNSSRPTSAFSQVNPAGLDPHHPSGIPVDQASTSQQNPNMLSVVQVIPSRLPDGQVVFLLPSHYVQLAAAAAANGISIGPNPPTAIWAATNMSLLKATDKLAKRPHEEMQDWQETATGVKPSKSPRMQDQPEQPLDFTTNSKKLKTGSRTSIHGIPGVEHQQQQQQQQIPPSRTTTDGAIVHEERPSSHAGSEIAVGMPSPSQLGQQAVKDEESMWRPW